jgi:photosystem II stability/assembly factor-like uncharacterized protein
MHRGLRRTFQMAVLVASAAVAVAQEQIPITTDTFGGLEARAIGPAVMSGRIAAVDAVASDPLTIFVGAASGGVWKSVNGGTTFTSVFDDEIQSIGAIAIDPSDPNVVWVGTGESWVRNSVSVGDGVYRSTDGGDSWQHVGLANTEHIARIVVDPRAHGTAYVCALGHVFDASVDRGVFKTTDGGKTWSKVLYVDADTGCSDLARDPQDPHVLYAGMWQFRRYADFFTSGGKGSGLYKSVDGGTTWTQLRNGLPTGEKGRIAVAVAPSRAGRVYALVEAKETALYRSDDLGEEWKKVNASFNVKARPFYFAVVAVDPADFNTVYKPGFSLSVSTDGGESFTSPFTEGGSSVHSDDHAIWIDPRDPNRILLGTDGGLYISRDRAHHFEIVRSLPVSQFYHVAVDMAQPYNVYGGLQDNGSWMGPSRGVGGIPGRDWNNIGSGDGFWAFPDPTDPDIAYVEYQGGNIMRVSKTLGEVKDIKPYAKSGEGELRFNWNAPIHMSERDAGTMYIGAQFLFRSRDRGDSWQRISPDLTTNDPKRERQKQSGGLSIDDSTAENNATIFTISESPLDHDIIWAGTDDGRLQVTSDGGKSWTDVAPRVPGVPRGTWVSCVTASRWDLRTAYAAFDAHWTGDTTTHVFRTRDLGATWEPLAAGVEGYAHVIKEDLVDRNLLFLGTEMGLWISLDEGRDWARFASGLPKKVPVDDLVVHPREGDLVIATHGRGIYILDDLSPLRALDAATLASPAALLPSRPAAMTIRAEVQDFPGDDEFVGANPRETAVITYWLKKRHIFGDLKVDVLGADGKTIATIQGTKRAGINRVEWPMRLKPPAMPPAASLAPAFVGPRVAEGTYAIRLTRGKQVLEGSVVLVADPRSPHTRADRSAQQALAMQLYGDLGRLTNLVDALVAVRDAAKARATRLGGTGRLARELGSFADELERLRATLVSTSDAGMLSGDEQLRERLASLYSAVTLYEGRPSPTQVARARSLEDELAKGEARFEAMSGGRLAVLNHRLAAAKLDAIAVPSPETLQAKPGAGGAASPGMVDADALEELLARPVVPLLY